MSTKREIAARLSLLLGAVGAHKFYQGDIAAGLLYLLFSWTFIPALLAFADFLLLVTMSDSAYDARYVQRIR